MHKILKYNEFVKVNEIREVGPATFDGYDEVIDYMLKHHEGQYRKFNKQPYAFHPARVAKTVEKTVGDRDLVIAAACHDILEDTEVNWKSLAAEFGTRVAKLVQELTSHIPSHRKDQKASFLIKKMIKISDDALTIKLADRLDNVSDIMDAGVPDKNKQKTWTETTTILKNLEKFRSLQKTHVDLINRINKYLDSYQGAKNESIIIYNSLEELYESN